jgi:flagellin
LADELGELAKQEFNGTDLFGTATVYTSEDGTTSSVSITSRATADWTSLTDLATSDVSEITTAIENVATQRAANGAEQSRLTYAGEMLTINKTNLESANSRIADVDVAEESTQLAKWNILVQSGTAMLAQANQSSQSALSLIS